MVREKINWPFLGMINTLLLCIAVFQGCEKNDDDNSTTATLVSVAQMDGYIENSSPRIIHNYASGSQGKEIRIGWNYDGSATRGFLNFDITSILPGDDAELVIEKAELFVYESNTNLHPFDGDGGNRTVEVYLVDYGSTLDVNDYNTAEIASCGTIASWGYNVLNEHNLLVTSELRNIIDADPALSRIQFRLQFTGDNNVLNTNTSDLDGSMWNIFSGDEDDYDEGTTDFRPQLVISYHHEKN
jgi:hypothetical protein